MPLKTKASLWLALKFVPRLSIQKKLRLVEGFGLPQLFSDTFDLSKIPLTDKQKSAFLNPDRQKINKIIEESADCTSIIVTYDDEDYPERLKEIHDPPLVLFVRGNSKLLNHNQVAIVGSRHSTCTGNDIAERFAFELSQNGVTVTSGLALGIDARAHKGAVSEEGKTIAIVATGLDSVYPQRHKKLFKEIIENGGAIVSEFPPQTPPRAGHFPKRNRIISGMSAGVVVVEAKIKSGSLITAKSALEQNREVFAVPGSVYSEQSQGCHYLIQQGAKLVTCCADILEELPDFELHLKKQQTKLSSDLKESVKSGKQDLFLDPLLASVGYEITPIDVVVSRSKLPTDVVITRLTVLELKGAISAVPGGYLRL